ncbi:hypothetical protein K3725_11450 [Leisingera sp. S132]|uniref:hypothetical protein n=1 Tax=Leisingera sp. S132 TaxID=2867016 RepID=UPI0021A9021F|nr:hypothetical protein [Leisingera sp. S132]UWQ77934.1 hypothetical protein K3725_11450 [Leisingera sp. S132]
MDAKPLLFASGGFFFFKYHSFVIVYRNRGNAAKCAAKNIKTLSVAKVGQANPNYRAVLLRLQEKGEEPS